MTTSDLKTFGLSDAQLAELEKLARAQERSVNEVLADAVDLYIKEKQWSALKRYGRAKSRELGLTEADVPRLILESRQERSQ
jgi:predicted transcriptional regulator